MARKQRLKLDSYRRYLYRRACALRRLNEFEFSSFIRGLVLSRESDLAENRNCEGVLAENRNCEAVNAEIAMRLACKINRHPLIWKLFFRVE